MIAALSLGIYFGIKNTINFSMINKLGHYQKCSTQRSADVTNPAQVTDTEARLVIEITHPELILADAPLDPFDDDGDVWILYAQAPAPCLTLQEFLDTGSLISELYLKGIAYRPNTDTQVGIYNTHFYYTWEGHPELLNDVVYCIYIDFIDANENYHFEEQLSEEGMDPNYLESLGLYNAADETRRFQEDEE